MRARVPAMSPGRGRAVHWDHDETRTDSRDGSRGGRRRPGRAPHGRTAADAAGCAVSAPLGTAALVAALVTTGLMAGLYYGFTVAVMPGLARAGDHVFVRAMRQINRAIRNIWFAITFAGSAVFAGAAAVFHLGGPALPWILAALVLYVATLVVTFAVNVPLNDALDGAPDGGGEGEAAAARAAFEARWVRWHTGRTLACLLALGCLAVAALLRGGA